jgi:uncharacterized protein
MPVPPKAVEAEFGDAAVEARPRPTIACRERAVGSDVTDETVPDRVRRTQNGEPIMSSHKAVVEAYFEGFRRSDHARILACLADDVVWDLPGFKHLVGKEQFDGEIENEAFTGSPTLTVDRMVEEGDTVVAIGAGAGTTTAGEVHRFAYCDVFTFSGDEIGRVESYLVPLTQET